MGEPRFPKKNKFLVKVKKDTKKKKLKYLKRIKVKINNQKPNQV
jgi:hypothetical protein